MALNRLEELDDSELFTKLEAAGLADKLETDPLWALLREACRRMAAKCTEKLVKCRPTDVSTIAECQVAIQFYQNVMPSILRVAKDEGELAFNELQDRGVVPNTEPEEK